MEYIDCKEVAHRWKEALRQSGVSAQLLVIQAGEDPASSAYIRGKIKDAEEIGFVCRHHHVPAHSREQVLGEVLAALDDAAADPTVDGVIVQLPLPFGLGFDDVKGHIPPEKDVDGFLPDSPFAPCTPAGVMDLLGELGVEPAGKLCVIAGRSDIVGKPLARLMTACDGTVALCHSRTPETLLHQLAGMADIFVSAVGKAGLFPADLFKDGAVVIDVGIDRTPEGLRGDIRGTGDAGDIRLTPVPGGVGLLTRATLMRHLLRAHQNRISE